MASLLLETGNVLLLETGDDLLLILERLSNITSSFSTDLAIVSVFSTDLSIENTFKGG